VLGAFAMNAIMCSSLVNYYDTLREINSSTTLPIVFWFGVLLFTGDGASPDFVVIHDHFIPHSADAENIKEKSGIPGIFIYFTNIRSWGRNFPTPLFAMNGSV
jgi:hypothetical protein